MKKLKGLISERRKSSQKIFSNDIEKYYNTLFCVVEKYIDEEKKKELQEFKLLILTDLFSVPAVFPTASFVPIKENMVNLIEKEWEIFENSAKMLTNNRFQLKSIKVDISLMQILNKIQTPVIIICMLGLLLGMSGMRVFHFSKNHYISNLVEGIYIVTKSLVTFLYLVLGISILSVRNINFLHTPINKSYILLSFFVRFLVMPGLGYLWVYLWLTYYGGIIETFKVFRITMFIPFCLPAAATAVVIINILKFFAEEASFILFNQNLYLVIILTFLYSLYYLLLGSY